MNAPNRGMALDLQDEAMEELKQSERERETNIRQTSSRTNENNPGEHIKYQSYNRNCRSSFLYSQRALGCLHRSITECWSE